MTSDNLETDVVFCLDKLSLGKLSYADTKFYWNNIKPSDS